MGTPDTIWSMQEDYPVPASGTIEYKNFEVPTNLTEDRWAQAIEVRPGNRSVVHHVIVYLIDPNPARVPPPFTPAANMRRPAEAPKTERGPEPNDRPMKHGPTGWLAGYAPGQSVRVYEPGTALRVPAGATLIIQEHYTATGKDTTDRTRVGIKWATEVPKTKIDVTTLQNMNFVLPAGSADTRVDAELTLKEDMTLWSLLPHTHMRGKKWEVTAIYPDGRSEVILERAEVRLQLADRLRLQDAAEHAEGHQDPHDGVVRQFDGEQGQSRSEERRVLGRPDLGGDAVHGDHIQHERRPGQDQQRRPAVMRDLANAALALSAAATVVVSLSAAGQTGKPAAAAPTFNKEVAPIFFKNCTNCHRPGRDRADVAAHLQGRASVGQVDCDAGRRRARCRRGMPIRSTASS